jgi:hypothetical protein
VTPFEKKFWSLVHSSGGVESCWPWQGCITGVGYGSVWTPEQRLKGAHVVAYVLANGPPPPLATCVLHTCDNRRCCNPGHLSAGTKADNSRDMAVKRRSTIGVRNPQSKLDPASVGELRRLAAVGVTQQALARQFGVSQSAVSLVLSRRRWRHCE